MAKRTVAETVAQTNDVVKVRRRFVSPSSLGLQLVERHKEVRDPLTKSVTHYETDDGRHVQRTALRMFHFRPSSVLWPPKSIIYKHRLVGVHVSDDPKINAVLEAEAKNPRGADIMEYPFEWEQEIHADGQAKEDKGLFMED